MTMQLEKQIAIVTGAARGIGRAIALELAARGADIAVIDYCAPEDAAGTVAEIEALGRRACFVACDVSDFDAAKAAVKAVREGLGDPDILINNAGAAVRTVIRLTAQHSPVSASAATTNLVFLLMSNILSSSSLTDFDEICVFNSEITR